MGSARIKSNEDTKLVYLNCGYGPAQRKGDGPYSHQDHSQLQAENRQLRSLVLHLAEQIRVLREKTNTLRDRMAEQRSET
jgi:hypothetical protein